MFEKWPWQEKYSTPARVTKNPSSTRFKKGCGNEERKFIACHIPSAREGKGTAAPRPCFLGVEELGPHTGWCVCYNVCHECPGGTYRSGFEAIVQGNPASFPIPELFCSTVMMMWFLSYSFHSRPGSCHIQGQGQDYGDRFSKSANA